MTLEEEILATESVVEAARGAAAEHLQRAEKDLDLGSSGRAHYKDFLDGTVSNASATLTRCKGLGSVPAISAEGAGIVRGLLADVRESVRLMYVAMAVVEHAAGGPHRGPGADGAAVRSCSFCGKSEAEVKLVAGPAGNICGSCTRLACAVLGIRVV